MSRLNDGFVRNAWYVAAWDHEVKRLDMMRRVILGDAVLLYRTRSGQAVALEDRCCHRQAALSQGRLVGDNVECGYHGFTYAPDGACIRIPDTDRIPPGARVRSYPIVERQHLIWIWMGDPDLADPEAIADFPWLDNDDWRFRGERLELNANYMLLVENLCDLSHLPFVHKSTLASTAIPKNDIPVKHERANDTVRVDRWVMDSDLPPYFTLLAGMNRETQVDRWMHLEFTPPSLVTVDIGAAPAGDGAMDGNRDTAAMTRNMNFITPETTRSTHYFWAQAEDFGIDDPTVAEADFNLTHKAFLEDIAMIEGQQRNLDLDPELRRVDVPTDAGGIQARRIVDDMIAAEQAG